MSNDTNILQDDAKHTTNDEDTVNTVKNNETNEEKTSEMEANQIEIKSESTNSNKVVEEMSSTQQIFDEKSGEAILQRDIPNKIIVARGKKISFYYERARRILRLFDGMIVTGFGTTVCVACSLVEVLKRNQMAVITHIETKLDTPINYVNINENYNNPQQQYYYQHAPPQTAIVFHLKVGKYGKYLSGYHQRKIIELFEKYDQLSGFVTVQDVKSMNLYHAFHSNKEHIESAQQFINDTSNMNGTNHSFILPDFIKYCSLIVHPLMKDNVFKKILYQNFRIGNYFNLLNHSNSDQDMRINNAVNAQQQQQQQEVKKQYNEDNEDTKMQASDPQTKQTDDNHVETAPDAEIANK